MFEDKGFCKGTVDLCFWYFMITVFDGAVAYRCSRRLSIKLIIDIDAINID